MCTLGGKDRTLGLVSHIECRVRESYTRVICSLLWFWTGYEVTESGIHNL